VRNSDNSDSYLLPGFRAVMDDNLIIQTHRRWPFAQMNEIGAILRPRVRLDAVSSLDHTIDRGYAR